MGREKQMPDLKPETIAMFEKFYKEYPELIDYRLKCGNVSEKAQAKLIKSVAESVLKNPTETKQSEILQNTSMMPTFITSGPQEQIDHEMRIQ